MKIISIRCDGLESVEYRCGMEEELHPRHLIVELEFPVWSLFERGKTRRETRRYHSCGYNYEVAGSYDPYSSAVGNMVRSYAKRLLSGETIHTDEGPYIAPKSPRPPEPPTGDPS